MKRREITKGLVWILGLAVVSGILACATGGARKQAPQPVTPEPAYYEHVVQYSGETLGLIASWYTGKSANWNLIRDANPGLRPESIRLGQKILIPRELVVNAKPLTKGVIPRSSTMTTRPQEVPTEDVSEAEVAPEKRDSGETAVDPVETTGTEAMGTTAPVDMGTTGSGDTGSTDTGSVDSGSVEVGDSADKPADTGAAPPSSGSGDDAERERLLKELLGNN